MFCKWCGNRITNNGIPCPICGKNQESLFNGNGFWDLCEGKASESHISHIEEVTSVSKNVENDASDRPVEIPRTPPKRKIRIEIITLLIIFVISVLIYLFMAIGEKMTNELFAITPKQSEVQSTTTIEINGAIEIETIEATTTETITVAVNDISTEITTVFVEDITTTILEESYTENAVTSDNKNSNDNVSDNDTNSTLENEM